MTADSPFSIAFAGIRSTDKESDSIDKKAISLLFIYSGYLLSLITLGVTSVSSDPYSSDIRIKCVGANRGHMGTGTFGELLGGDRNRGHMGTGTFGELLGGDRNRGHRGTATLLVCGYTRKPVVPNPGSLT